MKKHNLTEEQLRNLVFNTIKETLINEGINELSPEFLRNAGNKALAKGREGFGKYEKNNELPNGTYHYKKFIQGDKMIGRANELERSLTEAELRNKISNAIKKTFGGLSFDNFVRNGHLHINSKSNNPVIQAAWRNGWELSKEDEQNILGVYQARIMDGALGDAEPDDDAYEAEHPKLSWDKLLVTLNNLFNPQGYFINGSNHHKNGIGLNGKETEYSGTIVDFGTITVTKQ